VSDIAGGRYEYRERFGRGAGGWAGAQANPFRVWLDSWALESLDSLSETIHLTGPELDLGLDLDLRTEKPLVAHGNEGRSSKGPDPHNASYYVSFTRMATSGELMVAGERYRVSGLSWFDHEWSTSALPEGAVGWDWFSLQLSDRSELMLYRIRRADGSLEPSSAGTLIEADGTSVRLQLAQVEVSVLDRWLSPQSGAEYPAAWRIRLPEQGLDLEVRPLLSDQELRGVVTYWEGAVGVSGTSPSGSVSGRGYVELTGYAHSLQQLF
jgi:predicted secreted hydrolase